MNPTEEKKTAKTILWENSIDLDHFDDHFNSQLLQAMEEYAELKLREKDEETEQLIEIHHEQDKEIEEMIKAKDAMIETLKNKLRERGEPKELPKDYKDQIIKMLNDHRGVNSGQVHLDEYVSSLNAFILRELREYNTLQEPEPINALDKSLELFQKYLDETPKEQLDKDIAAVEALGITGPTVEEYFDGLSGSSNKIRELEEEIKQLKSALQEAKPSEEWISVKELDLLPKTAHDVWVCLTDKTILMGRHTGLCRWQLYFSDNGLLYDSYRSSQVTHWRPLPNPPAK